MSESSFLTLSDFKEFLSLLIVPITALLVNFYRNFRAWQKDLSEWQSMTEKTLHNLDTQTQIIAKLQEERRLQKEHDNHEMLQLLTKLTHTVMDLSDRLDKSTSINTKE